MVRQGLTRARRLSTAVGFVLGAAVAGCGRPATPAPPVEEPPPAPREFRAAWVATVANIDWPSRRGLPAEEQRAEILRIVERAKELGLNALILQVRSCADAIYPSELEPWSEFLTGEQGRAPEPFYDPLATWIDAAHARGLELHAWFNPYRARHPESRSNPSWTHVSSTKASIVKSYGGFLWMDPGEPAAATQTLDVVLDVVRRYDVDGVHIDDYFYPYPVAVPEGSTNEQDFPDDPAWQGYRAGGGTLARADWRRKNVSDLIARLYDGVHRVKPWVKSGISPFGVGRPDRRPPGVTGFSQYDKLYADVEEWMEKGWLDYLAPQLYWKIEAKAQPFGVLLDYWVTQNPRKRHVWPGLFTSKIDDTPKSWEPREITSQIALTRAKERGEVHFSMVSLLQNRKGIGDQLKSGPYATPALVPASPWLDPAIPAAPVASVTRDETGEIEVALHPAPRDKVVATFTAWARYGARDWRFFTVPASRAALWLAARTSAGTLERIIVSAVDRVGNESPRVRFVGPWPGADRSLRAPNARSTTEP